MGGGGARWEKERVNQWLDKKEGERERGGGRGGGRERERERER